MKKLKPQIKEDDNIKIIMPSIIKAAFDGDYKLVQDLLNNGVDVNTVEPEENLTCLHIACMRGDIKLAEIILEHNRIHNDVDFGIKTRHRPRMAWQLAFNANFPELAKRVDAAAQPKPKTIFPHP